MSFNCVPFLTFCSFGSQNIIKDVSSALPVKDTGSTSKGLSINRDTLLNLLRNRRTEVMVFIMALMLIILMLLMIIEGKKDLDSVGGGNALSDVALLRGLGAPGN